MISKATFIEYLTTHQPASGLHSKFVDPFLSYLGVPGVRQGCSSQIQYLSNSTIITTNTAMLSTWGSIFDLADIVLVVEDTNSIPTDGANREILGYVAMQAAPPGGQISN